MPQQHAMLVIKIAGRAEGVSNVVSEATEVDPLEVAIEKLRGLTEIAAFVALHLRKQPLLATSNNAGMKATLLDHNP